MTLTAGERADTLSRHESVGKAIEKLFEKRGRPVSKRRKAREMAVQMLYQSDLGNTSPRSIFADFRPLDYVSEDGSDGKSKRAETKGQPEALGSGVGEVEGALSYARDLVEGTLANLEEIDQMVSRQAEHWRLERMPAVDRNILRLAVYEFLYEPDVPKLVILDEAIELAKSFGSEQSGRFVNGVLDGILKSQSLPGSMT